MLKSCRESMKLYAITDRSWLKGETLADQVEKALQGGVTCVQLREKNLSEEEFEKEAKEIQTLCRQYDVPFIINDNVELAKKIDADGVHIGQKDMDVETARQILGEGKWIGVSAKTIEQAKIAKEQGATYLGVGAAFPTDSKADASEVGIPAIAMVSEYSELPVVAIGGINETNIMQLKGTGIDGVAVISAIFAKDDILKAAENLIQQVEEILENK